MTIIRKFIKQLNNTELGKGSTHDAYILIPQNVSIKGIFEVPEKLILFKDCNGDLDVKLKNTEGREKRIVGLGEYYRGHDLSAGDELILERVIDDSGERFYISCQKHDEYLTIQKFRDNFEILTDTKLNLAQSWSEVTEDFSVTYIGEEHKRADSPDATSVYKVIVEGKDLSHKYKNKDMVILTMQGDSVVEWKSSGWKQLEYEMEV